MSTPHANTGAVGIPGLQTGEDVNIDDLAEHCANMPPDVLARYPHLRRASATKSQPPSPSPTGEADPLPGSIAEPLRQRPKP